MATTSEIPFPRGTGSIAYMVAGDYLLELKRRELTTTDEQAAEYLRRAAQRHKDAADRAKADDLRLYGPRAAGEGFRGRTRRDKLERYGDNLELALDLAYLADRVEADGFAAVDSARLRRLAAA